MDHAIYAAMFAGFNDYLNDFPSRMDDYDYFTGPRYEAGRHLGAHFRVTGLDPETVTQSNIYKHLSQHSKEIYPYGGKHIRARN